MRRLFRALPALVALAALCAGCTGAGAPGCTDIGARAGIGLVVAGPLAADADDALVRACWADGCQEFETGLTGSTTAEPQECSGTGPDDSCSARAVPTGEKDGFVDIADLPEGPVQVTVDLRDADGERIFTASLETTPERIYPNGPGCGGDAVQLQLRASDDGLEAA